MSEGKASKPGSQFVEGLQLPVMFSAEKFRSAIRYKPHDDDVFIMTYPKCGTTWTHYILALIFRHGEPLESSLMFHTAPFLDIVGSEGAEAITRPGPLKGHLPAHLVPWSDKAKYIYVTRNPKDACVSYFYHMKDLGAHSFSGTFDEFFEVFISGEIDYGDYFDHLLGWYELRNEHNVLFMTYEEMKEDIKAAILKMASFIDDNLYAKPLRNDPEKLNNVVKYSSLKHMKESVNKSIDRLQTMTKEDVLSSDLPEDLKKLFSQTKPKRERKGPSNFVRKGIVGDWRNHFSEEQSKRMNAKFEERTKGTDIANWWKEYM